MGLVTQIVADQWGKWSKNKRIKETRRDPPAPHRHRTILVFAEHFLRASCDVLGCNPCNNSVRHVACTVPFCPCRIRGWRGLGGYLPARSPFHSVIFFQAGYWVYHGCRKRGGWAGGVNQDPFPLPPPMPSILMAWHSVPDKPQKCFNRKSFINPPRFLAHNCFFFKKNATTRS